MQHDEVTMVGDKSRITSGSHLQVLVMFRETEGPGYVWWPSLHKPYEYPGGKMGVTTTSELVADRPLKSDITWYT